jgi:hypothetical protein
MRRGFATPVGTVAWCGYCGTVFAVNYCELGGEPTLQPIENAAKFLVDRTF